MYCTHCGAQNAEGATTCVLCNQPIQPQRPASQPPPQQPQQPGPQPQYGPPGYPQPPYGQYQYGPNAYGQPPYGQPPLNMTNTWVLVILSTVCCGCPILGIIAIIRAAQAQEKSRNGDYAGALESQAGAHQMAWISIGVGVAITIVRIIIVAVSVANGARPGTF